MGRGVSCGGGKSSLGYLFGGGAEAVATPSPDRTTHSASSIPVDKQLPAGIPSRKNVVDKEISAEGNNHSRCPNDATASASHPNSAEGNNHTGCLNDATASASKPISDEGNNYMRCPNDATSSASNPISAEGNNQHHTAHTCCPNDATASASNPIDKNIPAGIHSNPTNNYLRIEGQNCGNFITDRPFTKVHAAPGGGSSLGYLFGGGGN